MRTKKYFGTSEKISMEMDLVQRWTTERSKWHGRIKAGK